MKRRAVCINLEKSRSRWLIFKATLKQDVLALIGPVERAIALTPETAPAKPEWLRLTGESWACYQSHLREIERAIEDDVDELLILEDDAVIDKTFVDGYRRLRAAIPDDWDALYLGGRHKKPPFEVNDGYVKCRDTVLHHAWMLSRSGLVKLRKHLRDMRGLKAMKHRKPNKDQWCGEGMFRKKFVAYAPRHRWLVHQRGGRSDRNGVFHPARFGGCRTRPDVQWPAA